MIFLALWALALLAGAIHVSVRGLWTRSLQRVTVFLLYQLAISWGLLGLVVFVGHVLRPAETAAQIGWPASPNFQFELGALELGVAVAAGLGLVIRNRYYWLGVILAPAVLMVFAGLNHLREALQGNLAPYNLGIVAPDLLIPLTAAGLLFRVFRLATAARQTPSGSA
jgi:hypothetical protein